ncbi:MAG: hypothetical protein AB2693_24860 [Candidatus Thiodiazotropha sp.]
MPDYAEQPIGTFQSYNGLSIFAAPDPTSPVPDYSDEQCVLNRSHETPPQLSFSKSKRQTARKAHASMTAQASQKRPRKSKPPVWPSKAKL